MAAAHAPSLGIVAYLVLFGAVGFLFLSFNLLLGRFIRSSSPSAEKSKIYECGEPSIGSSFVQLDLRFYVVALLFIIFDVGTRLCLCLETRRSGLGTRDRPPNRRSPRARTARHYG